MNSADNNSLVQSFPSYTPEGFYTYAAIRSSDAKELAKALEELIKISIAILNEKDKEFDSFFKGFMGESSLKVHVYGDHVVLFINLKQNPFFMTVVDIIELVTRFTVRSELTASFGVLADRSLPDLIEMTTAELEQVNANLHLNLTSTVGDSYKIKNAFIQFSSIDRGEPGHDEKVIRHLLLMFHSLNFKFHAKSLQGIGDAIAGPILNCQSAMNDLIELSNIEYRKNSVEFQKYHNP